jgi:hypothetical protein
MGPTGHWNRLEQRIWELYPQDILEQEKQKLQKAEERYVLQVDIHFKNGGSINTDHDWVFKFVVRQSLKEIQDKIDTLDFLEGVCLADSSEPN